MAERLILPLAADALAEWRGSIDKSRAVRKTVSRWWDANLKKYAPAANDDPENYGSALNTNRDFTLVERKKADLFYQKPDVNAIPSPLFAGMEHLLHTHAEILNEKLGDDGVDAVSLADETIFDVLCPSGTGWTKMGYDAVTVPTPTTDPTTGQPTVADVPIYQACFWKHFSPRQALIPSDFRSTNWDDAPWLGFEFEMPTRVAKRKGWIPEDFRGGPVDQELHFDHGTASDSGADVVKGVEIFYKSALYRDDQIHPLHQTQLILIEGVQQPAEHRDSPYQTLDPKGALTPDSLIGFPIHPLTMRVLTDSAHVPSDATITRPTVNEINKTRGQQLEHRDANTLCWMYNTDTLPPEALNKIIRSKIGSFIGVPGEAFVGEGSIKELPRGAYPRENLEFNDRLDNDLARAWAIDESQQGVAASGGADTATAEQLKQANANARLGREQNRTLKWYIKGVTKYSTLLQRFLPVTDAAKIVGIERAQEWDTWRQGVPASLAFTALPDSALRTDLALERDRLMKEYTFFANDPFVNRGPLLKHLFQRLHYPPEVLNTQPPEKSPEPTKPGLSLKGEDLNPLMPQFPILVEVLAQCGIKISPEAIAQAQEAAMNQLLMQQMAAAANPTDGEGSPDTQHGGKVAQMESLSKHANDATGGMQGTGAPAPMGAGGLVQ